MTIFDERIEKLRKEMEAEKIDFYLIPTADDHSSEYISDFYKVRNYYAGFTGSAGTLLIGMDMAGLWTDGRYFIQAENQLAGSQVDLFRMGDAGVPTVSDYLKEHMPPAVFETLRFAPAPKSFVETVSQSAVSEF